jgi:hypothetical protein
MMASPEPTGVVEYLKTLTLATLDGKSVWQQVNPSTFVWEVKPQGARVSLQRTSRVARLPDGRVGKQQNYILQETDLRTNELKAILNTADQPSFREPLEALFTPVLAGMTRAGLEFLKSLKP